MDEKENRISPLSTRSSTTNFDWKYQCFICGEKCDAKRDTHGTCRGYNRSWSYVDSSTPTDANTIYSKTLKAAYERKDDVVISRLLGLSNGDLVSVQARYHRKKGCLTRYLNTSSCSPDKKQADRYNPAYKKAVEHLIKEYKPLIITQRKVYDIVRGFEDGLFSGKLSQGKFNNVWLDYTLEVTQNKALKGTGGIIGLTLRENALARWFLARPVSSRYSSSFHSNLSSESCEKTHHTDTKSSREHHDKMVNTLIDAFDSTFIDPFDTSRTPNKMINFATGRHTTPDVEQSLLHCIETGTHMFETFVKERLVVEQDGSCEPKKDFFSPMQRSKVKTMDATTTNTKPTTRTHLIGGEIMFQRLLAINTYKKVPAERVFSFENTFVPMSLFTAQGKMIKAKKSDYMSKLEDLLPDIPKELQQADTVIFDGMAVIQALSIQGQHHTFKDIAADFVKHILLKARSISMVDTIHILFDRYTMNSLKTETRQEMGDFTSSIDIHVRGELRLPKDWKSFLSCGLLH